jgi:hypothetical protein
MMRIDGYAANFPDYLPVDDMLTDGWPDYSTTPFVAAHLLTQDLDKEFVLSALQLPELEVHDAYSRLNSSSAWPVFRIPLNRGNSLTCVYRNFEGDEGIDYLLEFEGPGPCARLASTDYAGPGISWPELYRAAYPAASSGYQSALRLLFFIPMMADAAAGEESVDVTTEALSSIGADDGSRALASALLDRIGSNWGRPHWMLIADDCMVCDGSHSPRNPDSGGALDPETLVSISRALNPH